MLEVRAAEKKDLDFIKDTYQLLDGTMTKLLKQLMDIGEVEEFEQRPDKYWEGLIEEKTGYTLIAFQEEKPVGIAVIEIIDKQEAHLEGLLVWPEFQKRGVGELLVKETKEYARKKGYKKISLNVLPNNKSARLLYAKLGFREVKISMLCNL